MKMDKESLDILKKSTDREEMKESEDKNPPLERSPFNLG